MCITLGAGKVPKELKDVRKERKKININRNTDGKKQSEIKQEGKTDREIKRNKNKIKP